MHISLIYSAVWRLSTVVLFSGRVATAGETPHILYFEHLALWEICACIILFEESFKGKVSLCDDLCSFFASFPGNVANSPNVLRDTTNRPFLKLQILVLVVFLSTLLFHNLNTSYSRVSPDQNPLSLYSHTIKTQAVFQNTPSLPE